MMTFPVPSEAFARQDIAELRRRGAVIDVRALRRRHPRAAALLTESGLVDVPCHHASLRRFARGLLVMLARPSLTARLLATGLPSVVRRPGQLVRTLAILPMAAAVGQELADDPPDVVHLFWGHYPALVGLFLRAAGVPVVISQFVGAYDLETRYRPGERFARTGADVVFTHAAANLEQLAAAGIPAEHVTVVHRGTVVPPLPAEPRYPRRIVAAGRLIPGKGFDTAIEAFAAVAPEDRDAELVIYGDGPDRARLAQRAAALGVAARVHFAGHRQQRELFAAMAESGIFLHLSRTDSERLPNVVKEAGLRGCACLVSATRGIEELIRHGETGAIVPVHQTVEAAAVWLRAWLADDARRAAFARAAREDMAQRFDIQASMDAYLRAWQARLVGSAAEA